MFPLVQTASSASNTDDEERSKTVLTTELFRENAVNILDGLQRTHILNDLQIDGHQFKEGQNILAEIWVEPHIKNLIYRIIVLNAGQKPMSMRHQVELLFLTMRQKVLDEIPGLEIYRETDATRRRGAKKLALDRVVSAYYAYSTRNPNVEKENIIARNLLEDGVTSLSQEVLYEGFEDFMGYLKLYVQLDDEICRLYPLQDGSIPSGAGWFGSENVICGFFAAVSDFGTSPDRNSRISSAIEALVDGLRRASPGEDVVGLDVFRKVEGGFNPRRVNVGQATRRLIMAGFKEFFREEGEKSLSACWLSESD